MDWDNEPTLKEFATTFNEYVDQLFGCGCMSGVVIKIKKVS